ncbi:transposase [Dactylosporangium sp. CA-092794]|uniref:transposase n=1 Tax=Dactylosporangium sp. CA-092794 TaxID=3239929 RepID=UPI003D93380D
MPGKRGLAWIQAHNLTITTTRRNHLILAATIHDSPTDHGGLHPSLHQARANCDHAGITAPMRAHLADAGYASTTTFTTPAPGILLIATSNEATQTGRTTPTQPPPPSQHRMTTRLTNPAGAALYRRRSSKVEPAFAQLFHHGGRQLHHRGPTTATEITLMATAHNTSKLITHLHRNTPNHHQT